MGHIINIWYIRNFHIICDRFPFPIFNNSILLIGVLFIMAIVVVYLESIFLVVNFWSIITGTFIFTLVFFAHICYFYYGGSVYICNEGHTRRFILLVFLISCPFPTRGWNWPWWLMWVKFISHMFCFIGDYFWQEPVGVWWGGVTSDIILL